MGGSKPLLLCVTSAVLCVFSTGLRELPESRRQLLGTWNPPAPTISTLPCPRTTVPTAATTKTLWVDPAYTGAVSSGNATHPFKNLAAAYSTLPRSTRWTTGITINIKPGNASKGLLQFGKIWATAEAPLVIQRDPTAAETDPPSQFDHIQVTDSSYVYFNNIRFQATGGTPVVLWISYSDYIYVLNSTVQGRYSWPLTYSGTAIAFKAYKSRAIYVEDSNVYGSSPGGMALMFQAVQYGHVCRSEFHHSDWCYVMNTGSAHILTDSNSVHHCMQAGLVMGWSTDFSEMISPYIQYTTYGMKVTNNVIHDVWGAGLSVFGGYGIVMAHNTLNKVGSRSHTVEIKSSTIGGCGGTNPTPTCAANYAQGGWGPSPGGPFIQVPSKNIMFLNNLIVNRANESAMWAHFSPHQHYRHCRSLTLSNPTTVTDGLIIRGNVFMNWHTDPKYPMSLGWDEKSQPSCSASSSCYPARVYAENLINVPGLDISFADPDSLIMTDGSKGALSTAAYRHATEIPLPGWSTLVDTPAGLLSTEVTVDRNGVPRAAGNDLPGAYYDPNYQPSRICAPPPNPAWAPNSTGWSSSCIRAAVGSVCSAPCGPNSTGADYTAQCSDVDTWTFLGGSCAVKQCTSLPPALLAPNSQGWNASCAGVLIGSVCTAACAVNATGTTYMARCDDTNTWNVLGGECLGPQKPWSPPTPPLPSYPCPKTEVPTQLTVKTLWVDPAYTGAVSSGNATHPFKTFNAAWSSLPRSPFTAGITINIKPGTALSGRLWMSGVLATADSPLIIQRDPAAAATDPPSVLEVIDVYNCTYMYFKGITFKTSNGGGNVVHFASCQYIHLLNVTIAGVYVWPIGYPGSTQALKINQVKGFYVEDSDIFGSGPNGVGLDGVAVQYGHVCRSKIHRADWCMYLKGGSAYFIIDGNEVFKCGQAGLEVGQGTGFEYMVEPWLQYEGYGMKLTNNVIHDVWGAGLGVNGGYSILMAHNTLYRVGSRSHTVEFNFGGRGCGGNNAVCQKYFDLGGWGPANAADSVPPIPSRDIMFLNNIIVNPSNESAMWCHFSVYKPVNTTGLAKVPPSMPNPITVTDGLIIRGNVFVNWHTDPKYPMSLGYDVKSQPGCTPDSSCYPATVYANNLINVPGLNLSFTDPNTLQLTDASKAALRASGYKAAANLISFTTWSTSITTPQGDLSNALPIDRTGAARAATSDLPGAWL